ncbi:Argonaute complex, subunit Arb1 [Podospora fimiseda]|uniref:Argonaute complex, subunit Arb1 n=1 Tax=Podospora fimiseda TaxID=252190 RepID=A0AAN7BP73_9PEZI|nr:Argonaute complex, subunit Arb1 [Podospora fimiseda]
MDDTAIGDTIAAGDETVLPFSSTTTVKVVEAEKKKKNRSKRSGKKKATGFEEYYCEVPMTPAEYDEEKSVIYAPGRPFVDRMEECIQRFRGRRRMDGERNKIFSEYLTLGGIDCSVRQFQSANNLADDLLEESSKSAIREMIADDVINRTADSTYSRYFNPNYDDHWEVDFTGVASGFLSSYVLRQLGNDIATIALSADVIGNFLRYVSQHDVCPEYAEDINKAIQVCESAPREAQAIRDIDGELPSKFCTALRILKGKDDKDKDQMADLPTTTPRNWNHLINMITAASSFILPELYWSEYERQEWTVIDTSTHTWEVTKTILPDDEARTKVNTINNFNRDLPPVQPCGAFFACRISIRDGWDTMFIPDCIREHDKSEVRFVIEESIVKHLTPGMKLTMVVCTTNLERHGGFRFIKKIEAIKPSYYVFLPQELMSTFKEPVKTDRPGRSIFSEEGFDLDDVPVGDNDDF